MRKTLTALILGIASNIASAQPVKTQHGERDTWQDVNRTYVLDQRRAHLNNTDTYHVANKWNTDKVCIKDNHGLPGSTVGTVGIEDIVQITRGGQTYMLKAHNVFVAKPYGSLGNIPDLTETAYWEPVEDPALRAQLINDGNNHMVHMNQIAQQRRCLAKPICDEKPAQPGQPAQPPLREPCPPKRDPPAQPMPRDEQPPQVPRVPEQPRAEYVPNMEGRVSRPIPFYLVRGVYQWGNNRITVGEGSVVYETSHPDAYIRIIDAGNDGILTNDGDEASITYVARVTVTTRGNSQDVQTIFPRPPVYVRGTPEYNNFMEGALVHMERERWEAYTEVRAFLRPVAEPVNPLPVPRADESYRGWPRDSNRPSNELAPR